MLLIGVLQKNSVANKILLKVDEINFPKSLIQNYLSDKKKQPGISRNFWPFQKKYIPTLGEMTSESALCN